MVQAAPRPRGFKALGLTVTVALALVLLSLPEDTNHPFIARLQEEGICIRT